jgi:hypothetical protein
VVIPIGLEREGFINAIVEVLVVREDDMATNIVELRSSRLVSKERRSRDQK